MLKIFRENPMVFLSYRHIDRAEKDYILNKLNIKSKNGRLYIEECNKEEYLIWTDSTELIIGDLFLDKIKENIKKSSVAILLLTDNFFTSDFILKKELPMIFQRYPKKLKVIPVIASECDSIRRTDLLGKMHLLEDGKPIISFDKGECRYQEEDDVINKLKHNLEKILKETPKKWKWKRLFTSVIIFLILIFLGCYYIFSKQIEISVSFENNAVSYAKVELIGTSDIQKRWFYKKIYLPVNNHIGKLHGKTDGNGKVALRAFIIPKILNKQDIRVKVIYGKTKYEKELDTDVTFKIKRDMIGKWTCEDGNIKRILEIKKVEDNKVTIQENIPEGNDSYSRKVIDGYRLDGKYKFPCNENKIDHIVNQDPSDDIYVKVEEIENDIPNKKMIKLILNSWRVLCTEN